MLIDTAKLLASRVHFISREETLLSEVPDTVQRKARKIIKKLRKVTFNLEKYNMGRIGFTELFSVRVSPYTTFRNDYPMKAFYFGVVVEPDEKSNNALAAMCRNIDLKTVNSRICRYPMTCENIFDGMVESLCELLDFLCNLEKKYHQVNWLPSSVKLQAEYDSGTNDIELVCLVQPRHLPVIEQHYSTTEIRPNCPVKPYMDYLVNALAAAAADRPSNKSVAIPEGPGKTEVDPWWPTAKVKTIHTWYSSVYSKRAERDKIIEESKDTVEKVKSKMDDILARNRKTAEEPAKEPEGES